MPPTPTKINVRKRFAAVFFIALLALSIIGLFDVIGTEEFSPIKKWGGAAMAILGVCIASFGIYSLFSNRFDYQTNTPPPRDNKEPFITITDEAIICDYPSQNKKDSIAWANVHLIQVLTTDEGPMVNDVFFVLSDDKENGVVIPQDKEESKVIVDRILKYPGFDYDTFIKAMGSTDNQWFEVWKKE